MQCIEQELYYFFFNVWKTKAVKMKKMCGHVFNLFIFFFFRFNTVILCSAKAYACKHLDVGKFMGIMLELGIDRIDVSVYLSACSAAVLN